MNHSMWIGIGLNLFSCTVAAVSQILLKKAAGKTWSVWWRTYINLYVMTAYFLFFVTTILGVLILQFIPLSFSAALGSSSQIFVPLFSYLFLGEKLGRRGICGMMIIVIGVVIFAL